MTFPNLSKSLVVDDTELRVKNRKNDLKSNEKIIRNF